MSDTRIVDNKSLSENEEPFRLLVESVVDYAIFMLDPQGYIISWNAGAQRIKGYTANEIIGQHFSKFYPPEDVERGKPQQELEIAIAQGRVEDEGWRVRKDGSRFWANVVITALFDDKRVLRGFAKVTRDITERRQAEQALHESEERFRLLVESVVDYAIYMLDPQGYIITWNTGAQRIKGYSADEIIGQHVSQLYTPEDIAQGIPQQELQRAAETGRTEDEGWRVRKDGSRFWVNVVVSALYDEQGNVRAFVKVSRDITERKQAEQALRESEDRFRLLAGKLEVRVRERTQELEEANRHKSQFLSHMSHELRTPLNSIIGYTTILLQKLPGPLTEEQAKQLEMVRSSARQLLALISGLLDLARIESGKAEINATTFKVVDVIANAVESVRPIAEQKSLKLSVTTEPEVVDLRVSTDEVKFKQILLNLLSNAVRYTDQGKVTLYACLKNETLLEIDVTDTGIGIPEKQLPRLFKEFGQLPDAGSRAEGGTGLGLILTQRLAELLKGTIEVQSVVGQGSTFTVRLPIAL